MIQKLTWHCNTKEIKIPHKFPQINILIDKKNRIKKPYLLDRTLQTTKANIHIPEGNSSFYLFFQHGGQYSLEQIAPRSL